MTNKIEINGETYIKESEIKGEYKPSKVQIVILNRGWIVVGKVSEVNTKTIIQDASVIRNWGTTKGLGELAEQGKLPNTVLDSCPDITTETCTVVLLMNCNQSKWA